MTANEAETRAESGGDRQRCRCQHRDWGSSAGDIWVAGSPWSFFHTNTISEANWGSMAHDVYAVGRPFGIFDPSWTGTIRHWDGTGWIDLDNGQTPVLYGVWGSGPTDSRVRSARSEDGTAASSA